MEVVIKPAIGPSTVPIRKSDVDYQSETLAALAAVPAPAPATGAVPPAPPPAPATGETAPAPVAAVGETAPAAVSVERGFDALVKKANAQRKQFEGEKLTVKQAEKLLAAQQSKDPMALLTAAGFSYTDIVAQITGTKPKDPVPAAADPVAARIANLEQQLAQERAGRVRQQAFGTAAQLARASPEKFGLTIEHGGEGMAVEYLERYYEQTGDMPIPGDFQGSLELALEAVEGDFEKQAKRWEAVLTKRKGAAIVSGTVPAQLQGAPKVAVASAASGQATQSQTLTNAQTPHASVRTEVSDEPRTAEDYQRKALAMLQQMGSQPG